MRDYTSFIGDRQTGAIYSCCGKGGDAVSFIGSCANAYVPPSGSPPGEYTFSRLSALDLTAKPNKPKMDPAWGFWRIDQANHRHAFCTRSGVPAKWKCFEHDLAEDIACPFDH